MYTHHKSAFVSTLGTLFLAGYLPVFAADQVAQADPGADVLAEVTVTARRVAEDVQRVPISISVLTQDQLQNQNIASMFDLQRSTPGFAQAGNTYMSFGAFMRGVGGVNQYFAGVPANTSDPSIYFDVANVQILKGPQGTDFGINNIAGSVLNEPRLPTDKLEGYVSGETGNYYLTDIQGVLNVPISDTVLLRVGGEVRKRDGFIYDIAEQTSFANQNRWLGRVSLTIKPTDALENTTMINYYEADEQRGSRIYMPEFLNPNGLVAAIFGNGQTFGGLTVEQIFAEQAKLGPWKVLGYDSGGLPWQKVENLLVANTTEGKISDKITVKNIFGYTSAYSYGITDYDSTPIPIYQLGVSPSQPSGPNYTFSEELQLIANLLNDRLKLLAGTYNDWSGQWGPHHPFYESVLGFPATGTSTPDPGGENHGVYFNGTLNLGALLDGLTLSGGYRYSWQSLKNSSCTYDSTGALVVCPPTQHGSWESPDYTVGLQYQVLPTTMLYVNNSTGSDSGFFNPVGSPPAYAEAQPEHLKTIEAGIKSNFHTGSMSFQTNFAGWYGWYTDVRTPQLVVGESAAGTPVSIVLTTNAAKAIIQGVEGSFLFSPVHSLEFSAAFNYNSNYFSEYMFEGQDVRKSSFAYMSKWAETFGGKYLLPTNQTYGSVSVEVNASYISRQATVVEYPANHLNDVPAYHIIDMVLDWRDVLGHSGLDARLTATNIENGEIGSGIFPGYSSLGYVGISSPLPRMWGLSLRYSF